MNFLRLFPLGKKVLYVVRQMLAGGTGNNVYDDVGSPVVAAGKVLFGSSRRAFFNPFILFAKRVKDAVVFKDRYPAGNHIGRKGVQRLCVERERAVGEDMKERLENDIGTKLQSAGGISMGGLGERIAYQLI